MLRISKLADYGTVIMAYLAQQPQSSLTARAIAKQTHLSQAIVSKVLKMLTRAGLLISARGALGGYSLAAPPHQITVAQIIDALDGGIALTECSHGQGLCQVEHFCAIQRNWQSISEAIKKLLVTVSLADMSKPITKFPTLSTGCNHGNADTDTIR